MGMFGGGSIDTSRVVEAAASFDDGGGGGGGGGGDELDLAAFKAKLAEINPQFFNANFGSDKMGGIAQLLENRGRGIEGYDPAFDKFRESQFNVFEEGATGERQNAASNLQRMGLGNSSTSIDQLGGVDRRLNLQRNSLNSQLGMQQMGRQDQALQSSLGAFGQSAAAKDMELNARTAGLENLLAIPSLQVSQQAAINAGKMPPPEEKGLLGSMFGGLF